ncbi:hypothetical protein IPO96_01820 [Candidatus Saccharibacteria bacterium]|nr:MAG: hypothetical protein IPO96_01820 [Candidatus Saccharibacteria bacterium]
MPEKAPFNPHQSSHDSSDLGGAVDPSILSGNAPLQIRFNTFAEARTTPRPFSDEFIDTFTDTPTAINGIKSYLDDVKPTYRDKEVIGDSDRIAELYIKTTEMIARNLRVKVDQGKAGVTAEQIQRDGEATLQRLWGYRVNVPEGLKRHHISATNPQATNKDKFLDDETISGLEYRGFDFNRPGVRANFHIQRQNFTTFIMAYSDGRVQEKMAGTSTILDKRIYLNPDMEATPRLFEQLLQAANQAGIPIQLKMVQRATEALNAHLKAAKGDEVGLRGDGIVVYTDGEHADDTLAMVLALAQDNSDAFRGRPHSRTPQNVAEGIGIADEPIQEPGISLTSHRTEVLKSVAGQVAASGKKGDEAHAMFRHLWQNTAVANGIDPNNLAFNIAT